MSSLFAPPSSADVAQSHTTWLLHAILWSLIPCVILVSIVVMIALPEATLRWSLLTVIVTAVSLVLLHLNRRGYTHIASVLLIATLWVLATGYAFTSGGVNAPTIGGYLIIIFLAGALLRERGGIATAVCSSLAVVAMVYAAQAGYLPPSPIHRTVIVIGVANILLIAILIGAQHWIIRWAGRIQERLRQELEVRRQAESALIESELRFRTVFEGSAIGIALVDLHGNPIETNPALQNIFGYSAQEFESMHFTEVVHPDEMDQARAFYTGLINGQRGQLRAEARCIRKDGRVIWCNTDTFLVCGSNDEPRYVVSMMEDITERKHAEEALQREREFTRTLLDNLADGVVACDADGKLVLFNRIARDWHGMAPAGDPPETWAERYHLYDADCTTPLPTQEIPLIRALRGETVHDAHVVIRAPGQPARHVVVSGGPFFDKNGDMLGAVVAMHDITARKQAEQALAREQYLMRILMDHVPDSIYFKDRQSRFIRINQAAAERYGFSDPAQAIGKTDFDVFTPEHAQPAYEDEQEIMRTGQPIVAKEETETWTNRPTAWVSTTKMPLRDEAGNIMGTFGVSRDITERKRTEEKLLYLSTHDVLTGLYNRAYFEQALAHLTHGEQYPISAVMIDVDRMKLTNDTLGHARGDELLRRTAAVMKAAFRENDIVARIGGDEFAVLLPQTDMRTAADVLDRLKLTLAAHNSGYEGESLSLSIGVATASEYSILTQTITRADQLMYRAKRERRYHIGPNPRE
ncbi:MAG: PAS domain S-box protein [Chloroflexi bacterium]|nr:PAS domain S-box protein [Chloroflexota bacterium]